MKRNFTVKMKITLLWRAELYYGILRWKMKLYYEKDSFKYEIENLRWKRAQKEVIKTPLQDFQVYDSLGHLVPILSDLT